MKNNTVSLRKEILNRTLEDIQQRNALVTCISYFSHRCGQTLEKGQLEEERADFCSSRGRVQFIMVGKAWRQEHETAGHTACAIRKQRDECPSSAPFLLLFRSGLWGGVTHISGDSSLSS